MNKYSVLKIEMGNITIKAVMQGFWNGENQPGSPMHNHAAFEFHMLLRGGVILETEQELVQLNEKDSVLIPPEVFHSFKNQKNESAILSFSFFIEKNRRKNGADYEWIVKEKLQGIEHLIVFSQNMQIEETLTKIVANIYENSLVTEERIKAQFMLFFAEIFSLIEDRTGAVYDYESDATENDTRIFMIEEYFNEYYMENISLKNLAERLYLSEKQTDRMIKKAFGESFRQHLCKIRLHVAKKLLKETDKEIRVIAELVGYESYNGFYMAFKEKTGMTPQGYREQHK